MAITQAMCNSFKTEILTGTHNFTSGTGHTFKIALYTAAATMDATTTAYSATNEITGTGYTATGLAMTSVTPVQSAGVAVCDFNPDPAWTGATFSTAGALIYNSSAANKAVCTIAFGTTYTVTAGTFTVTMPSPDSANAIIRIA
jgi:hypothetical protein